MGEKGPEKGKRTQNGANGRRNEQMHPEQDAGTQSRGKAPKNRGKAPKAEGKHPKQTENTQQNAPRKG